MSQADHMQLVCPGCGAFGSIETFAAHQDAAACQALYGAMPPDVAAAMQRYVRMFAPAKHVMTWRRARRVLELVAPLVAAQRIKAKGREWAAPHAAWISAINGMLESRTVELPLKSNGYLFSILVSAAANAEKQAEAATEDTRREQAAARAAANPDQEPMIAAQVRTAVMLLKTQEIASRDRYHQPFPRDEGAAMLRRREFGDEVVRRALDQHFGAAK